jgi:multicomponent K+:H+ antiporter subunit D
VSHWIIVPVLLPAFTAVYLLLAARHALATQRAVSVLSTLALVGASVALLTLSGDGAHRIYELGDWPAPFGIVLVLDRLSALMVLLTSVVAVFSISYAIHGWDTRGRNYHALFQFQLMGLNGAFLTGDIFNLFVFFEILLIASYGLLLHGGGGERMRAGVHYVVFNLAASALFLVALALIYGTLGTLNMADLSVRVAAIAEGDQSLVRVAALLLLVVFAAKAAVLPLYFWLPAAYAAASAPVAALFAIMTKVGIYSILRVFGLVFGPEAGALAGIAQPVLLWGGLLTLALASVGVVASRNLRRLTAYQVVASVGTLLIALGLSGAASLAAGLYYLVHSTLVLAALFLLVEMISLERGGDDLVSGTAVARPLLLGIGFFVGAVAITGMPPLSGFVGKTLVLASVVDRPEMAWVFSVVLVTSLLSIVAMARAGSVIFWKTEPPEAGVGVTPPLTASAFLPVAALLGLSALMVLTAGPVYEFLEAAAAQLMDPSGYVQGVLGVGVSE